MRFVFFVSILIFGNYSLANDKLICDENQLSEDCIKCLTDPLIENTKDICYKETLPKKSHDTTAFQCPERIKEIPGFIKEVSALVREVLINNVKTDQSLQDFRNSGGKNCDALPNELPQAMSENLNISEEYLNETFEMSNQCIKNHDDKVRKAFESNSKPIYIDYFFILSDAIVALDYSKDKFDNAYFKYKKYISSFDADKLACSF